LLSAHQRDDRKDAWIQLDQILKMEEIKTRQRAREKEIKEGDHNMAYLFAKANQMKREKTISCLKQGDAIFSENKDMVVHARQFYKSLFREEPKTKIKLDEEFWDVSERVTQEEKDALEGDMTEEEIFQAIKESYAQESPGLDGFSFLFYQRFWSTIREDFMVLVRAFHEGNYDRTS
jgi:hypothetical protein